MIGLVYAPKDLIAYTLDAIRWALKKSGETALVYDQDGEGSVRAYQGYESVSTYRGYAE